jgi:hypothetical protein
MDPITATAAATIAAEAVAPTAAMVAPSILAGTGSALTGAGMMTAGADLVAPSLLTAGNGGLLGGLGAMGSAGLNFAKNNPSTVLAGGLAAYDRMQPNPVQSQSGGVRKGQVGQYEPIMNIEIPQARYKHTLLG